MKGIIIITAVALFFTSCSNKQTTGHEDHNAAEKKATTREEQLYNEVMELHDAAMPKMGKLIGYKKQVQAKIDSLTIALKNKKDETGHELKRKYEQLKIELDSAENGMNAWMENFNPDPKLPTKADMEKYFEDQKNKAQKMKDNMFKALDKAEKAGK